MARKGWIKLWHKLGDSEMWLSEPFTRGQAWVDLLLMASTQETDRPGEVRCSIRHLSRRWRWSTDKVKRFLEVLEKDQSVFLTQNRTQNRTRNRTLLTVAKYRRYQIDRTQKRTPNETQNPSENRNIEEDKEKAVRTADAGGTEARQVPEAYRNRFATWEEYDDWRNQ